jgi:predicted MFS family arabinose efflux permease
MSSFSIFSLFAYAPLYIQGALGKTPVQVGIAMLSLSLGWSLGSLVLGQVLHVLGHRSAAIIGGLLLTAGALLTLTFSHTTTMMTCFLVFQLSGIGMGFVTLSTLLVVQNSTDAADLGVATTSHQFARTLGGTVGVGVCGGFATSRILQAVIGRRRAAGTAAGHPSRLAARIRDNVENLFQPAFLAGLDPQAAVHLQQAVGNGIRIVFWIVLAASSAVHPDRLLPAAGSHGQNRSMTS